MTVLFKNRYRRESTRLKDWDYSRDGYYFITICTTNRDMLFGTIRNRCMEFNEFGKIALQEWQKTFEIRDNIKTDRFIIMPNHVHGIVVIHSCRDMARHVSTDTNIKQKFGNPVCGSLSTIIGAYKSAVTKRINRKRNTSGVSVWQSRFYDRIIRNERELYNVRNYIEQNPMNWESDKYTINNK